MKDAVTTPRFLLGLKSLNNWDFRTSPPLIHFQSPFSLQRNSWVVKPTVTASSSLLPSPQRPPSCCPTTSPCSSKAQAPPLPLTFHPSHCLTVILASRHNRPSQSGTVKTGPLYRPAYRFVGVLKVLQIKC